MLTLRSYALNLLARREHSKFELRQKLARKGYAECDIITLVESLTKQGLQSDERFIEGYIAMRKRRGFGPVRIQAELGERGIEREQLESFLAPGDPTWREMAKVTRTKKFGKRIPRDLAERSKEMRYLYYKGFTNDQIKESLHE